jgi:hypothetical protein
VNGALQGVRRYAAGLRNVVREYPDFHWDLRHLLIDGRRLRVHLIDTYTAPAGRTASLQELAICH